jgi:hypothetical protein
VKGRTRKSIPARRKRGEHRGAPRVSADVPVDLLHGRGTMRDVSATGIFFETAAAFSVGSQIEVRLNLDTPWGQVTVRCDGNIVRVEPHDGRIGVAVQFADSETDAAPAARCT